MKKWTLALIAMALVSISLPIFAQLPPAAEVVPAGFKVLGETDLGGTKIIEANKPNENFPGGFLDQGIKLQITWQNNPAADMILNMLAQQPETAAETSPGTAILTEPCGKTRYRGGILICQKVTMPYIGSGHADPLVTWRVGWTGKGEGGLVGVGVDFLYGAKEAAMAWIDAIIPKIAKLD